MTFIFQDVMVQIMSHNTPEELTELQTQLKRAHQDLEILHEVSNAMRTTLNLNQILHIILTGVTAHSGLGFNRAILFLVNEKKNLLEPTMAIGPRSGEHAQKIWDYIKSFNHRLNDLIQEEHVTHNKNTSPLYESIKELKIAIGNDADNLLAQAYQHKKPMHISSEDTRQYTDDPLLRIFNTNELVIMPMKAQDEITGLIVADNIYTRKPITQEDLRIFAMLANQAAAAIENARLHALIIQKSRTDPITNLWNHGFFQENLTTELNQANTQQNSLSLIICDIDNFKNLNDTYGHQYGDAVLKKIATLIKECCRTMDHACRYGGEEFAIILPQTPKKQAKRIAERLRTTIAEYNFAQQHESPLTVTVSIGLATFKEDASNKEELIEKADKAMYCAKFSGKNQTYLA